MKIPIPYLTIFILIISCQSIIYGQWKEIPGPFGYALETNLISKNGSVFTIAMKDKTAHFVKTADLKTWSELSNIETPDIDAPELLADNGTFYLFRRKILPSFIQYSSDGGYKWFDVPTTTILDPIVYFVPVDNSLIACTDKKVYQSSDKGLNWKVVKDLSTTTIIGAKKLISGSLIISTIDQILISDDEGDTWKELAAPYPSTLNYQILKIYSNKAGLFIGTILDNKSAFYRSQDEGKTWMNINSPNKDEHYYIDELKVNNEKWWVISGGLFLSIDEGKTWEPVYIPDLNQFEISGDTLYSGGNYGFYKSFTAGKTWLSGNLGWKCVDPSSEYPNDYYPYQISFDYYNGKLYFSDNGVYSTDNEGKEWLIHDTGDIFCNFSDFVSSDNNIGFFGVDAYSSIDKGINWNIINPPFGAEGPIGNGSRFAATGKYVFGTSWTDHNIYRSEDGGLNWIELPEIFSFVFNLKAADNRLFVPAYDWLAVSEDFGMTYKSAEKGLEDPTDVSEMYSSGNDIFILSKGYLYKYLPDNSWSLVGIGMKVIDEKPAPIEKISGLGNIKIANCNYIENDKEMHLYISKDGGNYWQEQNTNGLPDMESDLCTASESAIYLAGVEVKDVFEGTFKIFKLDMANATSNITPIKKIDIYPNPSKGVFTVKGDFLTTANNKWTVYNSIGLVIAFGTDNCDLDINLTSLNEGYYYIKVENDNGQVTRPLLIVK